ncbi:MAG: HAD family phosphatase [Candidatus Fermentithermobacillus carboniphilus]|uniref:HAD family phosphatase n=1 Tax=Candidatus Fermentithermobacillus carboniphilus TaxID=3085328 RepID=A0AAT9LAQ0_9FIRM|nr:MAG: HAD family phosphatase [Candidatus Fermentithermobacillus carboniphilus]
MPIRLVMTDVDGTLLRSDGTLSCENARELQRIRQKGTQVVLATGRIPEMLKDLLGHALRGRPFKAGLRLLRTIPGGAPAKRRRLP